MKRMQEPNYSVLFLSSVFCDKETGEGYRHGLVIDDTTGRPLYVDGSVEVSFRVEAICTELAELGLVPITCEDGTVEVRI